MKLLRILLQFEVYFTFEPSKLSKLRPSPKKTLKCAKRLPHRFVTGFVKRGLPLHELGGP